MSTPAPVYTTAGATSFWRTYEVSVDNGNGTASVWGNSKVGSSNLRMAFSVTRKGTGGDPSAGGTAPGPRTLVLTNLSPRSRNSILRGARITLKTGYGPNLGTMFIGIVQRVVTERAGADINTNIELLDSEQFTQGCIFTKTYAPGEGLAGGVALTQILKDIADAMQLTYYSEIVQIKSGIVTGIKDAGFPVGIVFYGTCKDALDTLLAPQGLQWNVYNGALHITPVSGYDAQPAFYLSPQSGLINTPAFLEGKFAVDGRHRLTFQTLLNPQLQPGRLVTFQLPGSAAAPGTTLGDITGFYKVIDVVHKGDTHGQAWDTTCEAEIYEGTLGAVPVATGFDYTTAAVP